MECFIEAVEFHRKSNGQCPFENYFKRTINCPVPWANMNEPSTPSVTRTHPVEPELPSASRPKYFCKYNSNRIECFIEAMDLQRILDLNSNPMDGFPFENNLKRTINCRVTRANMNEPSTQRTNRYHFSVTWIM